MAKFENMDNTIKKDNHEASKLLDIDCLVSCR